VSKTAPYRHFRNKGKSLGALTEKDFRLLHEALTAEWPPASEVIAEHPFAGDRGTEASIVLEANPEAATWAYVRGLIVLRLDGLYPEHLPAPAWERLARQIPRFAADP